MDDKPAFDVKAEYALIWPMLRDMDKFFNELGDNIKPVDLVHAYVKLRDVKKIVKEKMDALLDTVFTTPMEMLEEDIRVFMQKTGVEGIKSTAGTAYLYQAASVTTADAREFRRHVIGSENWDLADWKPNKTRINELVEKKEPIPPGVNYSAIVKVGIRRPGAN